METESNVRLLYEWNVKYDKLDFAIKEAEMQLASVNKRLRMLWFDFFAYGGMIVLPLLLLLLLSLLPDDPDSLILILISVFHSFLLIVYMLSLPFTIAYLIKSIGLLVLNSEARAESDFIPPIPQGIRRGVKKEPERTYRLEQKKLLYVLSRYYLNRDSLNELRRQLESDTCTITLEELKEQLKSCVLYEAIHPANANILWKRYLPLCYIAFAVILIGIVIMVILSWLVPGSGLEGIYTKLS